MGEMQIKTIGMQELIWLNSILGGGTIPGVVMKRPLMYEEDAYVQDTLQKLEADGWIDEKRQLTFAGNLYARILKDYKNSSVHLEIQELQIALLKDYRLCIYVNKLENAVQMFYIDRLSILHILEDAYLRQNGLRSNSQMQLELKKYRNQKPCANHRFYGKNSKIYLWDNQLHQETECDEDTVYIWIQKYLEIEEE